jgi:hypothetical protein
MIMNSTLDKLCVFSEAYLQLVRKLNKDTALHVVHCLLAFYEMIIEIRHNFWTCFQWRGPYTMGYFCDGGAISRILLRPPYTTTFVNPEYLTGKYTLDDFQRPLTSDSYPLVVSSSQECIGAFIECSPSKVHVLVKTGVPRSRWHSRCNTDLRRVCSMCLQIEKTEVCETDLVLAKHDYGRVSWIIHDAKGLQEELAFIDQEMTRRGVHWLK